MVASCDSINCCLPARFLEIAMDTGILNYAKAALGLKQSHGLEYTMESGNVIYNNPVTQNIMLRSSNPRNKEASDFAAMSQSWIAALVSKLPYVINTLLAARASMTSEVLHYGVPVQNMLSNLITKFGL